MFNRLTIHESIVNNRNVRAYIPESLISEEVDDRLYNHKPGFELQIKEFISEKHSTTSTTSLKDAHIYIQIIKKVINYLNEQ